MWIKHEVNESELEESGFFNQFTATSRWSSFVGTNQTWILVFFSLRTCWICRNAFNLSVKFKTTSYCSRVNSASGFKLHLQLCEDRCLPACSPWLSTAPSPLFSLHLSAYSQIICPLYSELGFTPLPRSSDLPTWMTRISPTLVPPTETGRVIQYLSTFSQFCSDFTWNGRTSSHSRCCSCLDPPELILFFVNKYRRSFMPCVWDWFCMRIWKLSTNMTETNIFEVFLFTIHNQYLQ